MSGDQQLSLKQAALLLGIETPGRARTFLRRAEETCGQQILFRLGERGRCWTTRDTLRGAGLLVDDDLRNIHEEIGVAIANMRRKIDILEHAIVLLSKKIDDAGGCPGPMGPPGPPGPVGDRGQRAYRKWKRYGDQEGAAPGPVPHPSK